jgi:hypothetical protein
MQAAAQGLQSTAVNTAQAQLSWQLLNLAVFDVWPGSTETFSFYEGGLA